MNYQLYEHFHQKKQCTSVTFNYLIPRGYKSATRTMKTILVALLLLAVAAVTILAQEYANLGRGPGGGNLPRKIKTNGRGNLVPYVGCFAIGGCLAYIFQQFRINKLNQDLDSVHNSWRESDEINRRTIQKWKMDYQKLYALYEDLEKETVERDYEEFKAPDADNDDIITLSEFNTYVRKYLASFPELSEQDFPKFEEFDLNHDGKVTFDEWQQFLVMQKLKEDSKKAEGSDANKYNDLLNVLYDQSAQANGFSGLQRQLGSSESSNKGSKNQQTERGRR